MATAEVVGSGGGKLVVEKVGWQHMGATGRPEVELLWLLLSCSSLRQHEKKKVIKKYLSKKAGKQAWTTRKK